jgi:hypothetical protein
MMGKSLFYCALLALAGISLPATDHFQQQSSHTYTLRADGRVSLENINGNVHIRAWDRNEVRVEALQSARSARVLIDSSPQSISIRTNPNPGSVEFTITVPRHSRLDQVKLINGELDIEGVAGEVNASTVNGKLEVAFDRLSEAKSISLNAVNGNITLSIPYDARAELNARNVTGGISNDFGIPVNPGSRAGSRLHGVVKGGGTYINLTNVNGTISIMPVAHGRRVRFT